MKAPFVKNKDLTPYLWPFLIILFVHLTGFHLFAETDRKNEAEAVPRENKEAADGDGISFEWEWEFDAYYSNVALIGSLTDEPIPDVGEKNEIEIYKDLFLSSYLPRFFIVEASINPMPCLGVVIKKNERSTYEDAEFEDDFNLIKAITAGFEEPWALSLFLGDVVNFWRPGEKKKEWNKGLMGYLVSAGNYHIKDNELINDDWYEVEWKVKGDREYTSQKLNWSFRIGGKFHSNPDITDVLYTSIRRSRLDYEASAKSILKNGGIEYRFDLDARTFDLVRHYFTIDKKWPFKERKFAVSLTLGFLWESDERYKGSLREEGVDNFQVMIRPNLEF
jgi:hypothetical protein